jgi:hypothetical protein
MQTVPPGIHTMFGRGVIRIGSDGASEGDGTLTLIAIRTQYGAPSISLILPFRLAS